MHKQIIRSGVGIGSVSAMLPRKESLPGVGDILIHIPSHRLVIRINTPVQYNDNAAIL